MKKFTVLLFSVSLLFLFTSNQVVKKQKVLNDVAYYDSPTDRPIYPPVG